MAIWGNRGLSWYSQSGTYLGVELHFLHYCCHPCWQAVDNCLPLHFTSVLYHFHFVTEENRCLTRWVILCWIISIFKARTLCLCLWGSLTSHVVKDPEKTLVYPALRAHCSCRLWLELLQVCLKILYWVMSGTSAMPAAHSAQSSQEFPRILGTNNSFIFELSGLSLVMFCVDFWLQVSFSLCSSSQILHTVLHRWTHCAEHNCPQFLLLVSIFSPASTLSATWPDLHPTSSLGDVLHKGLFLGLMHAVFPSPAEWAKKNLVCFSVVEELCAGQDSFHSRSITAPCLHSCKKSHRLTRLLVCVRTKHGNTKVLWCIRSWELDEMYPKYKKRKCLGLSPLTHTEASQRKMTSRPNLLL